MGLFNNMKEPIFLKENSNAEAQLNELKALEPLLNKEGQDIIKQDIKYLEYGIAGEKNIAFELKNSHMPMYVIHDIYLEDGELSAQIDYIVFTNKISFVIECKNLYGDIEINAMGDFIRTIDLNGRKKKEGIYSPITQNQRHFELMKKIRIDSRNNMLTKLVVETNFEDYNKSIVVLANPKTVLNVRFAPREIKNKVIRADQLVKYLKDIYKNSKEAPISDDRMLEWAQSYLKLHKEITKNYTEKYEMYRIDKSNSLNSQEIALFNKETLNNVDVEASLEKTDIFKELKSYRLRKSREENIKPYFIYNDNQLKDLISKMPKNKEELKTVSGFGEIKANKYGDDILRIIKYYI